MDGHGRDGSLSIPDEPARRGWHSRSCSSASEQRPAIDVLKRPNSASFGGSLENLFGGTSFAEERAHRRDRSFDESTTRQVDDGSMEPSQHRHPGRSGGGLLVNHNTNFTRNGLLESSSRKHEALGAASKPDARRHSIHMHGLGRDHQPQYGTSDYKSPSRAHGEEYISPPRSTPRRNSQRRASWSHDSGSPPSRRSSSQQPARHRPREERERMYAAGERALSASRDVTRERGGRGGGGTPA